MKDASIVAGDEVSVVYVVKRDAKTVKNALEKHGWIDKSFRMTAAIDQAEILQGDVSYTGCLAIPVLETYYGEANTASGEWKRLVVGNGKQQCPFSTSVLGNPQKRHALQAATDQGGDWCPLMQALLQTVQICFRNDNGDDHVAINWKEHIQRLDSAVCPSKLELLGDDKNLVLPPAALLAADLDVWMRTVLETHIGDTQPLDFDIFLQELWNQVAEIYHCPRILRKGGVDPDSRIRQTGYQLLWPATPKSTDSTSTGPGSPGWITVTEQGIHQSFDVTSVMFSRGNITEKIRFGGCLVQPGDVVLDLYAGIGYYTLPAIVHGKAAYVYACEWNPKAIEALKYNLQDNRVGHKATVIAGDCRDLVLSSIETPIPMAPINRVSLGLLPSSEGSWNVAVQALMGTLPRKSAEEDYPSPTGGWLHIHGNVPVKERDVWSHWLCQSLHQHVQVEMDTMKETFDTIDTDWVVICHHVEKVKSFAPTVNHYVADVFVGPRSTARTCVPPQRHTQRHGDSYLVQMHDTGTCYVYDSTTGTLLEPPPNQSPPSCALSSDGALHQEWMMSRT